jgi:dipeptidase D
MTIRDLKPTAVWEIFDEITKVPRPSKKEEKIRKFILDFAAAHGIKAKTDEVGNVVLSKPATPGHENAPTVILQGHMDMVCESNVKGFDFDNNPITTIIDGEWVHADNTTLGADNGIGVAASLAAMADNTFVHGPLEALFTVDEETGMTGANNLGADMMNGSILLNLDSEDDGQFFIGCAGGIDTTVTFDYKRELAPADCHWFDIELANLSGGHSGGDIHEGRANSNKLLARFLFTLSQKYDVVLSEISGGNLRNAIPRAAHAVFGVNAANKDAVVVAFNEYVADVKNEYSHTDPNMDITLATAEKPQYAIDADTTGRLIRALYACPHGVVSMSHDLEGLVETSTNLAAVKMQPDNTILVTTSQRSSVESRKYDIANQVEALFVNAGAKVSHGDGYPGWAPNMNSAIMKIAAETYKELYGEEPLITAIHAGLECGLFLTKYPHLDMVSFGPTLRGVHSPSEKMHIPAVQRFWDQLVTILGKVAVMK